VGLEKNVVAVGRIRCNQVKEGVHLSQVVVDALLRFVRMGKTGSLMEHRMGFPRVE
jgi:hypothetical protein